MVVTKGRGQRRILAGLQWAGAGLPLVVAELGALPLVALAGRLPAVARGVALLPVVPLAVLGCWAEILLLSELGPNGRGGFPRLAWLGSSFFLTAAVGVGLAWAVLARAGWR